MAQIRTEADMPDQTGRRVLITGATGGLGLAQARALARKGAVLTLGVRNLSKGQAAAQEIRQTAPGADVSMRELDLASLASIARFAERFQADHDGLDLLINNAGVMAPRSAIPRTGSSFRWAPTISAPLP